MMQCLPSSPHCWIFQLSIALKIKMSYVVPSVVFKDTQDNVLEIDPCIRSNTFKLLSSEFIDQREITKTSQRKWSIGIILMQVPIWIEYYLCSKKRNRFFLVLLFLYTMTIIWLCLMSVEILVSQIMIIILIILWPVTSSTVCQFTVNTCPVHP